MRIVAASLVVLLALVGVASAQNCDPYLPCGPIPWQLPSLPDLRSPTPMPTGAVVEPGTPPPTSVSSGNIAPSATYPFDVSGINNSIATLQALSNVTAMPILDLTGTPFDSAQSLSTLTANTTTAFGYARGLSSISFGPLTPLVTFMFTAIFLFLSFNIVGFLFPLVMAILGVVRKIIQVVLDFIPF